MKPLRELTTEEIAALGDDDIIERVVSDIEAFHASGPNRRAEHLRLTRSEEMAGVIEALWDEAEAKRPKSALEPAKTALAPHTSAGLSVSDKPKSTFVRRIGGQAAALSISGVNGSRSGFAARLDAAIKRTAAAADDVAQDSSNEPSAALRPEPLRLSRAAPRENALAFANATCLTDGALTTWHWDERFWRWNGCYYECIGDKQIEDEIWKFLASAKLHDTSPFTPRPLHVNELKTALKSAISIDPKTFPPAWIGESPLDTDPHQLLVFKNGLVDARTGELMPLHPGFWIHDGAAYRYDPDATAPRWEEFLTEIFDDQASRDTLEEMLGYCMTYDTKFDKGFVLCGVKRSGKSTVMDVLEKLIGSKSYIGVSFSTLRNENSFQDVIDKKVIAFPDARFKPERTFYQSRDPGGIDPNVAEFLLNVTGRDTISLGRKYKSRWQGRLPAKIIITTNETPNLYDSSGVLPTRFIKLSFEQSFYDREDVHLRSRLESELPGIAARCLAALRRLNERGRFIQPEAGKAIGVAMEERTNPLARFCHDCLEIDPGEPAMSNDKLYGIFGMWCEAQGEQWLRRSIPNNQLVGKIRQIDGFEAVAMMRPHGAKRLYNLKRKTLANGA